MATHTPTGSGTPIPHGAGGGHAHHTDYRSALHWWIRAFWWTLGGIAFGLFLPFFLRWVFGLDPLWNEQVYVTTTSIFSVLGFLIGIGCFDWWGRWMVGKHVDYEDHSFHGATSWRDYLRVNTDHKVIGVQYLVIVFSFMVISGSLAELVRVELSQPGDTIVNGEGYNTLFSGHAALMIFLVIIPSFAGLANFVLPIMIGAKDMAFPKLNALSVWMLPPAGLMILTGVLLGGYSSGWTVYPPLAVQGTTGTTLFEIGVQFAGASSIMTAVNFLVTIITMRAPGMTVWRMPLLVWANATTSALVVFGTPFVAGSQFMTLFDRVMGTHFFDWNGGGDVVSYQHIFWFYSHPAVYIMMLPGFGIISEVLATFSRKPIFGYRAVAFSTVAIAVLGFGVWAHHMFVSGMSPWLRIPMMVTTVIIAIPTGVKVFSWVATLWRGKLHLKTPMIWALGFLFTFVIGGLSGVFLGTLPTDIFVSDTYYIVAHIHYVLFGGSVFTIFAGVYYWFPKMTGRMYNEKLGKWHFWLTFVGFNATFLPMHWLGLQGMPRRVAYYDDRFTNLNLFISIMSSLMVVGTVIFFYNMITSWRSGPKAPWNPWRGRTLEWLVSSPPSMFNFDATPQVVGGPYQYGIAGARHAIVFAPEEVGGGELKEDDYPTILVVAKDTVTGTSLLDAARELGTHGYWNFVFVSPADGEEERVALARRHKLAAAILGASGINVTGKVVSGDLVQAIARAAQDTHAHEIVMATYPLGESHWLRQDLVDRVRKATGLPVSHVTVSAREARATLDEPGLANVLVLAQDAVGGSALLDEIRARADRSPARFTLVMPADVGTPAWGDEANARRQDAVERVRRAVDELQRSGVSVQGEVMDHGLAASAREAASVYQPDEILVVSVAEQDLNPVLAAARGATVDQVVVRTEVGS
jgi:cytochrome c oxidase subunit 1